MILRDCMEAVQVSKKKAFLECGEEFAGGFLSGKASMDQENGLSLNLAFHDSAKFDLYVAQRLAAGNFGLRACFHNDICAEIDADIFRIVGENERHKVGLGINFSTGIKIRKDALKLHIFGFGAEYDEQGFGLRIPLIDWKYKWW
ncbi:unnamed protein product [Caenorhabditis brenneri]